MCLNVFGTIQIILSALHLPAKEIIYIFLVLMESIVLQILLFAMDMLNAKMEQGF